jgi:hypothetical protein
LIFHQPESKERDAEKGGEGREGEGGQPKSKVKVKVKVKVERCREVRGGGRQLIV